MSLARLALLVVSVVPAASRAETIMAQEVAGVAFVRAAHGASHGVVLPADGDEVIATSVTSIDWWLADALAIGASYTIGYGSGAGSPFYMSVDARLSGRLKGERFSVVARVAAGRANDLVFDAQALSLSGAVGLELFVGEVVAAGRLLRSYAVLEVIANHARFSKRETEIVVANGRSEIATVERWRDVRAGTVLAGIVIGY